MVRVTVPAGEHHAGFEAEYVRLFDATDTRPDVILCPCPVKWRQRPAIAQLANHAGGAPCLPNERTVFVIVRRDHELEDFDKLCPTDPAKPLYWIREGRAHVPAS